MARVAGHLSIAELEERFRSAKDPILARHAQVIWLLAQGRRLRPPPAPGAARAPRTGPAAGPGESHL